MADYLLGDISLSEAQLGQVVAQLREWYAGFYFQDEWKVTNKLTIDYGVRYELQPGYNETHDRLSLIDFAWNNSIPPTWVRLGSGSPY